jgi:hypothetical protein
VLGITTDGDDDGDDAVVLVVSGTVALAPRRTSTCMAATEVLAVAVTPNKPAILFALADAPAP